MFVVVPVVVAGSVPGIKVISKTGKRMYQYLRKNDGSSTLTAAADIGAVLLSPVIWDALNSEDGLSHLVKKRLSKYKLQQYKIGRT